MAQNISENRTNRHTQKRAFKEDLYALYAQIAPCLLPKWNALEPTKIKRKKETSAMLWGIERKPFSIGGLSLFMYIQCLGKNQCYSGKETPLI